MSQSYKRLKHCLIVDDDVDMRETLQTLLGAAGLTCHLAVDGEDAAAHIRTMPVDIIVSDYRMPRMNGLELLAWCRASHVHVPVVLLSAEVDILDVQQVALGDCCATVLRKPTTASALAAALDAADRREHHADCVHARARPKTP